MTQDKRFFIVENLKGTPIHVEHPKPKEGRDIKLGAYGARAISEEEWQGSLFLTAMIDAGHLKTYHSDKAPAPVPPLPPEAPIAPRHRQAIFEMAFGEGEVDGQLLAIDIINLVPRRVAAYGKNDLDLDYLKNVHHENLKWALWLLENFERAKYKDRIPIIRKRMEEIRLMF